VSADTCDEDTYSGTLFVPLEPLYYADRPRVKNALIHLKSMFPLKKTNDLFD
jgi:hypothetical protein